MSTKPQKTIYRKKGRSSTIDFQAVNQAALSQIVELLRTWFPNGRRAGNQFVVGNLRGDPGTSLKVALQEGFWKDFATGEGGGDPVSLYAARYNLGQREAARSLANELGLPSGEERRGKRRTKSPGPEAWRPVVPVPRDAPAAPQLKSSSSSWAYKDQQGRLLGYVLRIDRGSKKQVFPLTYCDNGRGQRIWRKKALPKPRPLYGLDRLARLPNAPVLVVEGEKTADAAQALCPSWAVVSWSNGSEAVKTADWEPLKGRRICVWPDNDQAGRRAASSVGRAARTAGATSLDLVEPPADVKKGWDLADALEEGWTTERVESHIHNHSDDLSQGPLPSPMRAIDDGKPKPPFRPLGHNQGQLFFFSSSARQVIEISASGLTNRGTLFSIAPLAYWKSAFPGSRDFDINATVDSLISSCHAVGVYDPNRIRGRGAWRDGDRTIFHLGDRLVVDGVQRALEDLGSRYIYIAAPPFQVDLGTPLDDREAEAFLDLCLSLQWESPTSGWLLAGWCAVASLCGILPWRPHIWITGGAGAGKTWVLDQIIRPAVGELGLFVQSKTTEAGLRQTIGSDARPIIFDEAEGEDPSARKRLQDVIELARASSSEEGTDIVKGSASGQARRYKSRACFAFSSINVGLSRTADESRTTVLPLLSPANETTELRTANEEHFVKLREMQAHAITNDFGNKLLTRVLCEAPSILANNKLLSEVAANRFASRRHADQVAILLAGAVAFKFPGLLTRENAAELVDSLDWHAYLPLTDEGDERRLLDCLLQQQKRFMPTSSHTWAERSIGELVAAAFGQADDSVLMDEASDYLKRCGFKVGVEEKLLYISNNHCEIANSLQDTPWPKGWPRILKRLPGATTPKDPVRFTSADKSRATAVPLSLVLEDVDNAVS